MITQTGNILMARTILGFLEKEGGFVVRENPPRHCYFETSDCEILAIFELSKAYVSIAPIGNAKSKLLANNVRPGRVDIKIVCQCLDPDLVVIETPWNAKSNLEDELIDYANLINKYCGKMVSGDFSQWHMIRNCLKIRGANQGK